MSASPDLIGRRVRLVYTNDPYTNLVPGDIGTVVFIDDTKTVFIKWDNGSNLGLIDADEFAVLTDDEVVADYLGCPVENVDGGLANIETCISIISMCEPGQPKRNPKLIAQAFESIMEWAADMGVEWDSFLGEVVVKR